MGDITYKRADTEEELTQILDLQRANIQSAITEEESKTEGFVTVHHSFELLKAMNDQCPHVIAKHNDNVVGYTLCMLKEFRTEIEILKPMFRQIEASLNHGDRYLVMGQVCVDKTFRKQGIFRGLYEYMKQQLRSDFDMIITEVDIKNSRSLESHYAIGFELMRSYRSGGHDWALISLNLG
jgi:hypothetical protein